MEAEGLNGGMADRERDRRILPNAVRRSQPARNRWDWRLAGPARRTPPPALELPPAEGGRHWPEPCFASATSFPDFDETLQIPTPLLPDNDPGLPSVARSLSIAPRAGWAASKNRGRTAIAISAAFHAALLLFFVHFVQDAARIAGGEQAGAVLLGNADQNQLRSGEASEPNVTHVALISVSKARPVETAAAAPVAAVEALEPAEPAEAVQSSQVITPMEEASTQPETIAEASAVPADAVPSAPSPNDVPSVLATDAATVVAAPEAVAANAATEGVEGAKPIESISASSEPVTPVRPIEEPQSEEPVEPAEIPALPQRVAERPSTAKREKPVAKHHQEVSSKAAKRAQREAKAPSSGSRGKGDADQREGRAEGSDNGRKAAAGRGAVASAEGNAAVSNYQGKIVRKLRRALRYPNAAGSRRLRGVAQVGFVISAVGGVGGIHLVASSGSPILDKAALEAVRRAAPFPPIPVEAGRSSWPFTVPLAFVR